MKVGELAREAGVNIETVRFYERQGLLPEPFRRASGYRDYDAEGLRRLRFIRRLKALGFSLAEITSLLSLGMGTGDRCGEVRRRVAGKIADLDVKIQFLEGLKAALEDLAAGCVAAGTSSDCPLLDSLERREGR